MKKLFLGVHIDNGRIKDDSDFRSKSCLRTLVDTYNLSMVLSPTQSIILKDIKLKDKEGIE
jgi:sulfite reductase (ferredoxin)